MHYLNMRRKSKQDRASMLEASPDITAPKPDQEPQHIRTDDRAANAVPSAIPQALQEQDRIRRFYDGLRR